MREPTPEVLLANSGFLRALARSILRDEQAAEDVAQEALLAAARGAPPEGRLRAWLGSVTRNLAVSRLRSDRRHARREREAARPEAHGDVPAAVARLEAQQRVVEAVLALEAPYRAVVLERFFYDRRLPEVAERLGIPAATARTRLRRALAMLKGRLDRRMGPAAMLAALSLLARPARAAVVTGATIMSTKPKVALLLVLVLLAVGVWILSSRAGPDGGARRVAARETGMPDAPERAPVPEPAPPPTGPSLSGRCVEFWDAAPLAGVRVRVGTGEATTDASGRFRVSRPDKATDLVASKEGFADAVARVQGATPDTDLGDIVLRPLLVLNGIVVTPADEPASGAMVVLRTSDAYRGPTCASTTADEDGRFTLHVPEAVSAPGPVRDDASMHVAAYLRGFVEGVETVSEPGEDLRVRLRPARTVRGLVVDSVTGEGIAGAELRMDEISRTPWCAGRSSPDGSFEAAIPPLPENPGHIVPGLNVYAKGYAPRRLVFMEIASDGNRIALDPAVTVHGRLTLADGTPAAGIRVTSTRLAYRQPASSPRMAEMEKRMLGGDPPKFKAVNPDCTTTETDASGGFTVEVPRTPPFRISATAWPLSAEKDFTDLPDEPVTLVLDFQEDYHALVRVRVVDPEHRAIAGAAVTWWAVPGAAGEGMGRSPASGARSDAEGYAEVWTNRTWTKPVLFFAWSPGWFGVSRDPVDRQRLTEPTEIVCEPAGIVHGRVVGAPLQSGARASLWWNVGGDLPWRIQLVRIDREGRFALPGAPAGRSTLVVADPRGPSLLREIDVPAGGHLDLGNVALEPPALVRGVVRNAKGEPGAGAWLWWEPKDPYYREVFVNPYWGRLKADENGAFELPVWVQGPVHIYAQGAPFMVVPEGVPQAGMRVPYGGVATGEYRPGDGPLTLVTQRR